MLKRPVISTYRILSSSRSVRTQAEGLSYIQDYGPNLEKYPGTLPPINDVAILGGGITGLSSAYYASLTLPNAKIKLYESSANVGGWMKSTKHEVDGGTVIFEHGPRSLRPDRQTLAMIVKLGLEKELLITPRTSPAAKIRYIWYDDRIVNVQKTTWSEMFNEELTAKAVNELLRNVVFAAGSRPGTFVEDESVGAFLRRLGLNHIADNLVSAVLHGIYAGDINELSVRSVFPNLIELKERFGHPLAYQIQKFLTTLGGNEELVDTQVLGAMDPDIESVLTNMDDSTKAMTASTYTLKGGLQTLVTALIENLEQNPRVEICTEAKVVSIGEPANGTRYPRARLTVQQNGRGTDHTFDRVISTIPSASHAKLVPHLRGIIDKTPASTVCVVNLYYSEPNLNPPGFGFLIPRTIPINRNPEGAIGVVFDSDATRELNSAPGTKLTVMLGGPFWKDWPREQLPSNAEAVEMARNVVAAHLGITETPVLSDANLQVNCIPQYTVGHQQRMEVARQKQPRSGAMSCIKVAGSWYNGVGVNDCIASAATTVRTLRLPVDKYTYLGNESGCVPRFWSTRPPLWLRR